MLKTEIRPGAYYDSVVLMQLQRALAALPAVLDAGVVMGAAANKELLLQSGLLTPEAQAADADDLVIVVSASDEAAAQAALAQVNSLLERRSNDPQDGDYRPKSLEAAVKLDPDAQWVLVSTPGRYAVGAAQEALRLGRHLFLYSDNVSIEDEVALKRRAAEAGLLVMGPDCGTAIVNGVGLGFANRVRRGSIGLVGASGTGLQHASARIHQLGGGITHAFGTGGRDLGEAIGAITARQCLDLLARDADTSVIVLISKPPSPAVAETVLRQAQTAGKPVVVQFVGYRGGHTSGAENIYFAHALDQAAALAVELAAEATLTSAGDDRGRFSPGQQYLRGLYSGGTLAYEAQVILCDYLPAVYSNAPLDNRFALAHAAQSQGHTVLDLGADEFTVGRLHPMLDNDLRIRRLRQEAADPETAVILLDVVLGDGAHPDPAAELAPAIEEARRTAQTAGRLLAVIAVVVGTDEDPQHMERQIAELAAAGAQVETDHSSAVRCAAERVRSLSSSSGLAPVELAILRRPVRAINVGLESFRQSLADQGAPVTQVDWRPPAGGNERLMGILARMKAQKR
jgi:FdrA protein